MNGYNIDLDPAFFLRNGSGGKWGERERERRRRRGQEIGVANPLSHFMNLQNADFGPHLSHF